MPLISLQNPLLKFSTKVTDSIQFDLVISNHIEPNFRLTWYFSGNHFRFLVHLCYCWHCIIDIIDSTCFHILRSDAIFAADRVAFIPLFERFIV
jgi:hypothetical protein